MRSAFLRLAAAAAIVAAVVAGHGMIADKTPPAAAPRRTVPAVARPDHRRAESVAPCVWSPSSGSGIAPCSSASRP